MTREGTLFAAELSARYHRRRATFLERSSALMSVAILAGGAGAFASLFGETTIFAKVATLAVAIVGIVQVVFQVDRVAADHRRWLKQWLALIYEIKADEAPETVTLNGWVRRQLDIEGECVGELRALQVDCFNRAAIRVDPDFTPTPLRWHHRALIQIVSFEAAFANPLPRTASRLRVADRPSFHRAFLALCGCAFAGLAIYLILAG